MRVPRRKKNEIGSSRFSPRFLFVYINGFSRFDIFGIKCNVKRKISKRDVKIFFYYSSCVTNKGFVPIYPLRSVYPIYSQKFSQISKKGYFSFYCFFFFFSFQ